MTRGKHEHKCYRQAKSEKAERNERLVAKDGECLDDEALAGASGGKLNNEGRKKPF